MELEARRPDGAGFSPWSPSPPAANLKTKQVLTLLSSNTILPYMA